MILFGGFYINSNNLPPGSSWVQYISFVTWGFKVSFLLCNVSYHNNLFLKEEFIRNQQSLAINQFHGLVYTVSCSYPSETMCEVSGEEVLQQLGFHVCILCSYIPCAHTQYTAKHSMYCCSFFN
jgi:hypothetical protein